MATAETARLLASLDLKDNFSGTATKAAGSLSLLERSTASTGGGFTRLGGLMTRGAGAVGTAVGAVGGALGHLKSRVGEVLSGPLGLLGLGAGLFSVGHILTDSIGQARDFGTAVLKLRGLTGLTAETTSELAAAFEHFGINADDAFKVVGFAEKNLFNYGGTAKKAEAFQKQYNLSLVDSKGQLLDFNSLLLRTADYFNNKSIPAQEKAAALAKIYGRSWQTLLPILGAGRVAIQAAEEEAVKLGLTLTSGNLASLVKLRDATREWNTALGGLKLQIGLAIIPLLTTLTTNVTGFVAENRTKIVDFVKTSATALVGIGRNVVDVFQHQVIPVVSTIYGFWQKIPADVRNFLIRGLIADRTIKFLLGFSPLKLGVTIAEGFVGGAARQLGTALFGGIGGLIGKLVGSKAIPQLVEAVAPIPVFVTNPGFGLPGGGGGPNIPVPGATQAEEAAPSLISQFIAAFKANPLLIGAASVSAIGLAVAGAIGLVNVATTPNERYQNDLLKAIRDGVAVPHEGDAIRAMATTLGATQAQIIAGAKAGNVTLADMKTYLAGINKTSATTATNTGKPQPINPRTVSDYALRHPTETQKPIVKLDAKDFLTELRKTAFIGPDAYKSIYEKIGGKSRDPFGEQYLTILKNVAPAQLKLPGVMADVKGHIDELANLEKYYLSKGQTANAEAADRTLQQLRSIAGLTQAQTPYQAQQAAAARATKAAVDIQTQRNIAHYSRLEGLDSATAANTGETARKNFSPKVNVSTTINVSQQLSVSAISGAILSFRQSMDSKLTKAGIY